MAQVASLPGEARTVEIGGLARNRTYCWQVRLPSGPGAHLLCSPETPLVWGALRSPRPPPQLGARRRVYGGLPWVWVLSLLVGPPLVAQADITSNLVGYWALDPGTGTTAIDSSTSNITLTLANGPTWALPGKVGAAAVSFVAANSQALEVPIETTSPLWPNTGDFTVAAWIKLAATGAEHGIAGTWSSSGALWYMRVNNTGTLLWVMTDVDTASITVFGTGTIT